MSVLLSAAREKNRQKNRLKAKPKKKSKRTVGVPAPTGYIPNATTKVWNTNLNDVFVSIGFQIDTMDVWANDELIETTDNFNDEGAEIDFCIFDHKARIQIISTGRSDTGMDHVLTIDGARIEQTKMAKT